MRYEDVPSHETFGKGLNEIYAEGTEVGYRYYNRHNIPVRFPFGFGLSYTTFEHSEWTKEDSTYTQKVTNTGDRFGGEVAQLFLDGELKGFEKVYLNPGETKTVSITVEDEPAVDYPDTYTVPEETPRYPVTVESRFTDLNQSFMGRILYNAVLSVVKKQMKQADKMPDGPEKDNAIKGAYFMKRIMDSNSPRSLSMCARNQMPYNFAEGFVELTNGHLCKGIRCFLKKIKVPKLPKEEQNA